MTDGMHPNVAIVLQETERLKSLLDDQLEKMANESFTATDDAGTVEVTLNGHHCLTDVFIEAGLLRLGAEAVAARVNEALQHAEARASAVMEADRERLDRAILEITSELDDYRSRCDGGQPVIPGIGAPTPTASDLGSMRQACD